MVKPIATAVHVERIGLHLPSGLSPRVPSMGTLELGEQLRPDRDHPDKHRDRRQRRRFFHENLQHFRLLKTGT